MSAIGRVRMQLAGRRRIPLHESSRRAPGSPFGRAVLATLEEKAASYRLLPVVPGTFRSPEHLARVTGTDGGPAEPAGHHLGSRGSNGESGLTEGIRTMQRRRRCCTAYRTHNALRI